MKARIENNNFLIIKVKMRCWEDYMASYLCYNNTQRAVIYPELQGHIK